MLKELTADILKVDMNFMAVTEDEERSRSIVTMVIALAKKLDMQVITEGVETKEQVDYLAEAGSDMYQGYYFSKPMPLEEFEAQYIL
ncbi:MAG: EAL domain-containing protein [Bacteroidaceae bacterium]|nr:EAL domain-containing protein [Bacteroidaceae bacterium]